MALKDKGRIPYGGQYRLNWPEGGMVGFGTTFEMLLTNIQKYRKANAIPVGLGLEDEIEQALCREYPKECCHAMPDTLPRAVRIGFQDVINGTRIMIKQKLEGVPLVSQEEADRRAEICSKCPMKSEVELQCARLCGELETVVRAILGGRETPSESLIQNKCCRICHCFLSSSCWVDLGLQTSVLSDEQKQHFKTVQESYPCWKIC